MAKVKYKDKVVEIEKGQKATTIFDDLGITYGCSSGNCGKCIVEIKEGIENLNPIQDAEEAFGLFENERLFCQCVISGDIEINQE